MVSVVAVDDALGADGACGGAVVTEVSDFLVLVDCAGLGVGVAVG